MSLAQDIRNAYDARDRDALEWALSRIPNIAIINSGPLPPGKRGCEMTIKTVELTDSLAPCKVCGTPPRAPQQDPTTFLWIVGNCQCGGCLIQRATPEQAAQQWNELQRPDGH